MARKNKRQVKRMARRHVRRRVKRRRARKHRPAKRSSKRGQKRRFELRRRKTPARGVSVKGQDNPLLETLTQSAVRARLLRLLLRDPQVSLRFRDIAERLDMPFPLVRRELALLEQIGVVSFRRGGGQRISVLQAFPFLSELRILAVKPFPISRSELIRFLSRAGTLQLVVVSGVFLQIDQARVDLFVVASRFSEKRMESAAKKIEARVGAELRWAGMDTREFQYRWKMFDRFLRDIFAHPHEKLIEKIKL